MLYIEPEIIQEVKKMDQVLRRKPGESSFNEMLIGDVMRLAEHKEALSDLLSDELVPLIITD